MSIFRKHKSRKKDQTRFNWGIQLYSYSICKKFWQFWVMYDDGRSHSSANEKRKTLLWFTFRFLLTTQPFLSHIVNTPPYAIISYCQEYNDKRVQRLTLVETCLLFFTRICFLNTAIKDKLCSHFITSKQKINSKLGNFSS